MIRIRDLIWVASAIIAGSWISGLIFNSDDIYITSVICSKVTDFVEE
jgi:hypothetical protein